jgi:hypothetical protein
MYMDRLRDFLFNGESIKEPKLLTIHSRIQLTYFAGSEDSGYIILRDMSHFQNKNAIFCLTDHRTFVPFHLSPPRFIYIFIS